MYTLTDFKKLFCSLLDSAILLQQMYRMCTLFKIENRVFFENFANSFTKNNRSRILLCLLPDIIYQLFFKLLE